MLVLKLIIWLIILIVIVTFSVQNLQAVEFKYYNFYLELKTLSTPLIVVLLGSLFCGITLASLFSLVSNMRLKNTIRKQNQTIKGLDKQVAKLTLNATSTTQPTGEQK